MNVFIIIILLSSSFLAYCHPFNCEEAGQKKTKQKEVVGEVSASF